MGTFIFWLTKERPRYVRISAPKACHLQKTETPLPTSSMASKEMLTRLRPEAEINWVVAGSVDGIETNPDAAFAVNATASGLLAEACAKSATPLIRARMILSRRSMPMGE